MAKTIRIEDFDERPVTELSLSGGVVLQLRPPPLRPSLEPSWAACRPGWGNARAAADRLLSASIVGPVDAPALAELSEYERRRLVVAVAGLLNAEGRWRGLYGTTLTLEERLLAIAVDARRRETAELRRSLRERRRQIENSATMMSIPKAAKSLASINPVGQSIAGFSSINRNLKTLGGVDRILRQADVSSGLLGIGGHQSAVSKMLKANTGAGAADYRWSSISGPAIRIADAQSIAFPHFAIRNASAIAGLQGIGATFDLNGFGFSRGLFDMVKQWRRTLDTLLLARFAYVWSDHELWFLLRDLTPAEVRGLINLDPAKIHSAVVDALEQVIRSTPAVDAIEMALNELSFLDPDQREWLQDGLDHLRHRRWVKSLPPLILGFEGAIYNGAVAAEAWAATRGKEPAAEAVIKAIDLDEALRSFTVRLVFGGRGNAIRHGRPKNEAREQALLMVVAIIGWIDSVLGTHGAERLVQEIRGPLLRGIENADSAPALEAV